MEEEREKRKQWWREWRKLSRKERKTRIQKHVKRRRDEYLKRSPELMLAEAQVQEALFGILAGLMFTASVLFFSIGRELPYGEWLGLLTLTDTAFFVFAAFLVTFHADYVEMGELYNAYHFEYVAEKFGFIGAMLMLVSLIAMGFSFRLEIGIILCIVIASAIIYFYHRMHKHLVTDIID